MVWGIVATLREASEINPRFAGCLNPDLAEYVLPVNADIGSHRGGFHRQPDTQFNSASFKGLREVSMTGVAAAIANAVYHATGRRLRDMVIHMSICCRIRYHLSDPSQNLMDPRLKCHVAANLWWTSANLWWTSAFMKGVAGASDAATLTLPASASR